MNGNGVWKWAAGLAVVLLVSLSTYVAGGHIDDLVLHESVDNKHARIDARLTLKLDPIYDALERIEKRLEKK